MNLWHDVRFGARTLSKSPGFVAIAVLTMALCIGATTATYSVTDALLWKPIPLPRIESLAMVLQRDADDSNSWDSVAPPDMQDIRAQSTSFEGLSSFQRGEANIVGPSGEPDRALQALVNANFFEVTGVQPVLGRGFQAGEDQPGHETEVVLSNRLWRRSFGGDAGVLGRRIRLDDQTYTVIGVMPDSFDFPVATELWTPLALTPKEVAARKSLLLLTVARLKPGRTIAQASSELDAIGKRLETMYPDSNKGRQFVAWPVARFIVDTSTRQYVLMLLGAVIFVLLIGCVNLANLQFARASGRMREVALRTALGASRGRVITQLITESVLLTTTGALFGLLVAQWSIRLIVTGMPQEVARFIQGWHGISLDERALAFTLLASVGAGILAGLAPAWQVSRPNLTETLKEGGRGSTFGRGRHFLRHSLVAVEVILAVVLLVGASLMVRGFRAQLQSGRQLEPATLLTFRLALTDNKYHEPYRREAFYREVVERVQALPGVRNAAAATFMPYSNHSEGRIITIEGRQVEKGDQPAANYQSVTAGYFETLHIPLRAGRRLTVADGVDSPRVAVVSERMVERFWKNQSPIGRRFKLGPPESTSPWITVVGVVGNVPHNPYDHNPRATMFVPLPQAPILWMAVRTVGDPLSVATAVTAAVHSVDAEQPITEMRGLEKSIHNNAIGLNYMAWMMGIFGLVALVLSAVGVYGVMTNLVSEETHEIGIRMALGSPRHKVLVMVFRRGLITAAIGLVIGIPAAYAMARALASLVYGVTAGDPVTFVGIPAVLLGAATLAIYLPARRATHIDPIVALRYE